MICSTKLNKSVIGRHPCSDFWVEAFSLGMMFIVVFHKWLLLCCESFLFVPSLLTVFFFLKKKMFSCIKFFFCISWNGQFFFPLYSFRVVFYIHWFPYVEPSLCSRDKSLLVMICNLCNMLLNLIHWYFHQYLYWSVSVVFLQCLLTLPFGAILASLN